MTVNELVNILARLERNDDVKIVDDNGRFLDILDVLDLEDEEGTSCYLIELK